MTLETPVEYYYGETLRWSFGFDNPNKAAVLFACAVPLLWWLWQASWRINNRWARLPALVLSASLLAGSWYCLIMTFSRGGLVAAVAALIYQIGAAAWQGRKSAGSWPTSGRVWVSALLVMVLIGGTLWNGLGSRSAEALGNDASVGNRVELWGSALQMAAENPRGFGGGKSGEQYMQWYQPLDRQQGYRTMVNSYLTFLVEQGWLWSFLATMSFALIWVWTKPGGAEYFPLALRASILGFLVAGFFSTTMEEWRLWVMPAVAAVALVSMALWHKRSVARKPMLYAAVGAALACAGLWAAGWQKSSHDPLRREFGEIGGWRSVTALGPKSSPVHSLGCVVDEVVLGDQSAKLLRELALNAGVTIMLGGRVNEAERILCMGQGVHDCGSYPYKPLLLLAPEKIRPDELAALAKRDAPVLILMPEIDEDGRVGFWDEITGGELADHFQLTALASVGNRVDWAWAQVVELVKDGNVNP